MQRLIILLLCISVLSSCENNSKDEISPSSVYYLVDKVYDYNNNLISEYIYDDYNQLILRKDRDTMHARSSDYVFLYDQNKLSQIIYLDYNYPQFNHEIHLVYDEQGYIIYNYTTQNENQINADFYNYDQQHRLTSIYKKDPSSPYYYFYYDSKGNVTHSMHIVDVSNDPIFGGKDTIQVHRFFKYDDKLKPNFSLNNIFQVELYPYFGTEATIEKALSKNNMIEFVNGTQWMYNYNTNGLPIEIETKWKDVVMLSPLLHRITYKTIKAP